MTDTEKTEAIDLDAFEAALDGQNPSQLVTDARALAFVAREQREEIKRLKGDYGDACKTVADMHHAATGSITGPNLGVVEDVASLRTDNEEMRGELQKDYRALDSLAFMAGEMHSAIDNAADGDPLPMCKGIERRAGDERDRLASLLSTGEAGEKLTFVQPCVWTAEGKDYAEKMNITKQCPCPSCQLGEGE